MIVASESGDALEEFHPIALEFVETRLGVSDWFIFPSFKRSYILYLLRLAGHCNSVEISLRRKIIGAAGSRFKQTSLVDVM
jgi:hypothetical protein